MKKKIITLFILLMVFAPLAAYANSLGVFSGRTSTAHAVGGLDVDWGVARGLPIFTISNLLPGDFAERSVIVANDATSVKKIGVSWNLTDQTNGFSEALLIQIYEGSNFIYGEGSITGPKTVKQFFDESAGINGLSLFDLNPGDSRNLKFKVVFKELSGNEYQNAQITFDLLIGIVVEVPIECEGIEFSGTPIHGTRNRDVITGTSGNDLIITYEGNDQINSGGGDDCILAGIGADQINSDGGDDVVFGDSGYDQINGQNGSDRLIGGPGNDQIVGGNGEDYIEGNQGNDDMFGNQNDDQIFGGAGVDRANGGQSVDFCQAELVKIANYKVNP